MQNDLWSKALPLLLLSTHKVYHCVRLQFLWSLIKFAITLYRFWFLVSLTTDLDEYSCRKKRQMNHVGYKQYYRIETNKKFKQIWDRYKIQMLRIFHRNWELTGVRMVCWCFPTFSVNFAIKLIFSVLKRSIATQKKVDFIMWQYTFVKGCYISFNCLSLLTNTIFMVSSSINS